MADSTVQQMHDTLLGQIPAGVVHECGMCSAESSTQNAKEESAVADITVRTFTEDEHLALLTDAVKRETATVTGKVTGLEAEKAQLQAALDVTEAGKATAVQRAETAEKDLADFKQELANKEEIEARREERVAAMKEKANHLPDSYFTAERAQRWAEMDDESFNANIADLVATAPAVAGSEQAGKHQEAAAPAGRETAAFGGNAIPKPEEASAESGSTIGQFLGSFIGSEK